jgi:hypothetical protein
MLAYCNEPEKSFLPARPPATHPRGGFTGVTVV